MAFVDNIVRVFIVDDLLFIIEAVWTTGVCRDADDVSETQVFNLVWLIGKLVECR